MSIAVRCVFEILDFGSDACDSVPLTLDVENNCDVINRAVCSIKKSVILSFVVLFKPVHTKSALLPNSFFVVVFPARIH